MDLTAMTMCMEHRLPVEVFDFRVAGNVKRAVLGERVGTIVTAG
jgi:uridylate kinase